MWCTLKLNSPCICQLCRFDPYVLIANVLQELGFTVMLKINADQRSMKESIRRFGKKLRSGGVGLFYFAGHGIQVKGYNFLIPIGADIESEADVEYEAIDAGRVLAQMENAENDLNIIILDACRDNPFARNFRSSSSGLAKMDAPRGSILAYATAPGAVASDGPGRNGLYTSKLLKYMSKYGLKIEGMFKQVRVAVMRESENKQVPWEVSSLTGDFYFKPERGLTVVKPSSMKIEDSAVVDQKKAQLEQKRKDLERLKMEIELKKLEAERQKLEAIKKEISSSESKVITEKKHEIVFEKERYKVEKKPIKKSKSKVNLNNKSAALFGLSLDSEMDIGLRGKYFGEVVGIGISYFRSTKSWPSLYYSVYSGEADIYDFGTLDIAFRFGKHSRILQYAFLSGGFVTLKAITVERSYAYGCGFGMFNFFKDLPSIGVGIEVRYLRTTDIAFMSPGDNRYEYQNDFQNIFQGFLSLCYAW